MSTREVSQQDVESLIRRLLFRSNFDYDIVLYRPTDSDLKIIVRDGVILCYSPEHIIVHFPPQSHPLDLSIYKKFYIPDYDSDSGDIIEAWTEEELNEEEQYARPDYFTFSKTMPLRELM